ncbi:RtcB family protein [Candidatus Woesearchaeota archaeon]|nr:RtcB family protein [Candidatus Woesearchaeota archaeon]
MLKENLRKLSPWKYVLDPFKGMHIPAYFYVSDKLLQLVEEDAIRQAMNVAMLPSLVKGVMVMSDVHTGYGFPIGGVAASRYEEGIISPGGIGFDINCGVRLLKTDLSLEEVEKKKQLLIDTLYKNVPSGLGEGGYLKLSDEELMEVMEKGSYWALEKGYATRQEVEHTEENGRMKEADPSKVSKRAMARGRKQLGTLGSGNHFLEIQIVEKIFDPGTAKAYGLEEGMITIMIHCGSRGLGHQVASDYLRIMNEKNPEIVKSLPDRELVYASINSEVGMDYLRAMASAANYAWVNRQLIAFQVRKSLRQVFGHVNTEQLYDVAHNIAKIEEHIVDGEKMKLIVHRKGATRAFPKNSGLNVYDNVGQPVIIPGSMGTSSYILVGTEKAMKESFGSSCHGAGRVMSRRKAISKFNAAEIVKNLGERGVIVKSGSRKGIAEESPDAYKDVDEVVRVVQGAGIARIVAKLKPLGVIKG